MAPRKRKTSTPSRSAALPELEETSKRQRTTKSQTERSICQRKLSALEQSESYSTDDRFTGAEKESLLTAFSKHGFPAFQDMKLLKSFLPNRTESDLKGLLDRLRTGLQKESAESANRDDTLGEWQKLCHRMMGKFAKDATSNMDNALADALMAVAEERELSNRHVISEDPDTPNYPELFRSFAQLLQGKFPDNMTPANARVSMRLFEHINNLVDQMNLSKVAAPIENGSWLSASKQERQQQQQMALEGLTKLESMAKKCPSVRDLERSKEIEALCLELPKIKRITELLNPLCINESLVNGLID